MSAWALGSCNETLQTSLCAYLAYIIQKQKKKGLKTKVDSTVCHSSCIADSYKNMSAVLYKLDFFSE